jgi:hypothetical protein
MPEVYDMVAIKHALSQWTMTELRYLAKFYHVTIGKRDILNIVQDIIDAQELAHENERK